MLKVEKSLVICPKTVTFEVGATEGGVLKRELNILWLWHKKNVRLSQATRSAHSNINK